MNLNVTMFALFCTVSLNAASAAGQTASASPAAAAFEECKSNFDPAAAFAELQKKGVPRSSIEAVENSMIGYAQCNALARRDPTQCDLLAGIRGNNGKSCESYFHELILWKDLQAGAKLDELDQKYCRTLSSRVFRSANSGPKLCSEISKSYAARKPFCASLSQAFPDKVPPESLSMCEADASAPKPTAKKPGVTEVQSAVRAALWSRQRPDCSAFPFGDPQANGACAGVFTPNSCESLILPFMNGYCGRYAKSAAK
jgi:hypothetical protein